jgi:hypothetical protein
MTYIDENYNMYRSPQSRATDRFNDNASLVDNAASPAGTNHRMVDLGEFLFNLRASVFLMRRECQNTRNL